LEFEDTTRELQIAGRKKVAAGRGTRKNKELINKAETNVV